MPATIGLQQLKEFDDRKLICAAKEGLVLEAERKSRLPKSKAEQARIEALKAYNLRAQQMAENEQDEEYHRMHAGCSREAWPKAQ